MPLGTLDHTPPPFFRQGPSALTRLVFFASLALFLMVADVRLKLTPPLRKVLVTALLPIEQALLGPVKGSVAVRDYFGGVAEARKNAETAEDKLNRQSIRTLQADQLLQENARLRALLGLRERLTLKAKAAQVIYDSPDIYTRKVVIDAGSQLDIREGSPVINEQGLLGQVTRVYPLTSEVTLLVDRDAALAVVNTRTQARAIAAGDPTGNGMTLRFIAGNADVQVGDVMETTGLDGVYPAGMPVASVARVDRRTKADFAHIALATAARPDGLKHVLVLDPIAEQLPPPSPDSTAKAAAAKATAAAASAAAAGPRAASAAAAAAQNPLPRSPANRSHKP